MTAFRECAIHHLHGALESTVLGGRRDGAVKVHLVMDKQLGIVRGLLHAFERGTHDVKVFPRGATGSKAGGGGFKEFAQFVELHIADFVEQKHPLQMAARHAGERGLALSRPRDTRPVSASRREPRLTWSMAASRCSEGSRLPRVSSPERTRSSMRRATISITVSRSPVRTGRPEVFRVRLDG